MMFYFSSNDLVWFFVFVMFANNLTFAKMKSKMESLMCEEIRGNRFECKFCDKQELDCTSRGIIDGLLTSDTFSLSNFVPNHTKIINLSGNELTYLGVDYSEMWVDGLNKLVFSHNEINAIYASTFDGMSSLESLDLSYNQINFLQSDVFENLEKLQTLDLSHNLLPRIDGFWFQGTRELIRLNLGYNQIGINYIYRVFPNDPETFIYIYISSN